MHAILTTMHTLSPSLLRYKNSLTAHIFSKFVYHQKIPLMKQALVVYVEDEQRFNVENVYNTFFREQRFNVKNVNLYSIILK